MLGRISAMALSREMMAAERVPPLRGLHHLLAFVLLAFGLVRLAFGGGEELLHGDGRCAVRLLLVDGDELLLLEAHLLLFGPEGGLERRVGADLQPLFGGGVVEIGFRGDALGGILALGQRAELLQ
jgi:hypothetical protein